MSRYRQYRRIPTPAGRIGKLLAIVVAVVAAGLLFSLSGGPKTGVPASDARFGALPQERAGTDADRGDTGPTRRDSAADRGDTTRRPDSSARESARAEVTAPAREAPSADRATRERPDTARTTPATPTPAATPNELAIRAVTHLADVRRAARRRLARARTAGPQSAAARELEAAYGHAARRVERLETDSLGGLSAALRSAESAYAGLATAIANGDQRQYDVQRKAILAAEADVKRESSVSG